MSTLNQSLVEDKTQYGWILGCPVQTDNTNYEWVLGAPYIVHEHTPTGYSALFDGESWSATETPWDTLVSTSGKLRSLKVELLAAPGVGKSYTFTMMLNGVGSSLTCTISGTDTTGEDTSNEVDVVGGDKVALRCVPDSGPDVTQARWSLLFETEADPEVEAQAGLLPGEMALMMGVR